MVLPKIHYLDTYAYSLNCFVLWLRKKVSKAPKSHHASSKLEILRHLRDDLRSVKATMGPSSAASLPCAKASHSNLEMSKIC